MRSNGLFSLLTVGMFLTTKVRVTQAGMPAVLPTNWTKDNKPNWISAPEGGELFGFIFQTIEAISFFVAIVLVSAWIVKQLWNSLRVSFRSLPELNYSRSLSFVVLWGLLFVVVLTMISGARELMTPGAWRKQGWTYKLASAPAAASTVEQIEYSRSKGLVELRAALWHYAATHGGRFPDKDDPSIDPKLWQVSGLPGAGYRFVTGREPNNLGQLLAYEPEIDHDQRQVLLTNGVIGTMRSSEIRQALASEENRHDNATISSEE